MDSQDFFLCGLNVVLHTVLGPLVEVVAVEGQSLVLPVQVESRDPVPHCTKDGAGALVLLPFLLLLESKVALHTVGSQGACMEKVMLLGADLGPVRLLLVAQGRAAAVKPCP